MIQHRTMLAVADNSGAKLLQCIRVMGGSNKKYAQIGDIIIATVKQAEPRKLVKKHDKVRCVVVRQRKPFGREDGSYIRFDENAVVILEKEKEPKGGRIFGPVARELKDLGFDKIVSLAAEVL